MRGGLYLKEGSFASTPIIPLFLLADRAKNDTIQA